MCPSTSSGLARVAPALLLLLVLGTTTSACVGLSARHVAIARGVDFDLLPPASLHASLSLEQIIDARYGERSSSFHCLLEVDPRELVLVALTPFGTRAFVLTLRDDALELEESAGETLPASPARILADLQLALWADLPAIPGLDVVETIDAQGRHVREFQRHGTPVMRVTCDGDPRWRGNLRFEHLEQAYVLEVHTVREEGLSP